MTQQEDQNQQKVRDLVDGVRFAMLTTIDQGRLVSRPMTVQRIEQDLKFLFITQRNTDVAQQSDGAQVNLAFVDDGTFVSVTGTGALVDDVELKKELWDAATDAFTEEGPEDPSNVILAITTETASYWDSPTGPASVFGMLKAAVTGGKSQSGEHDTVDV